MEVGEFVAGGYGAGFGGVVGGVDGAGAVGGVVRGEEVGFSEEVLEREVVFQVGGFGDVVFVIFFLRGTGGFGGFGG